MVIVGICVSSDIALIEFLIVLRLFSLMPVIILTLKIGFLVSGVA